MTPVVRFLAKLQSLGIVLPVGNNQRIDFPKGGFVYGTTYLMRNGHKLLLAGARGWLINTNGIDVLGEMNLLPESAMDEFIDGIRKHLTDNPSQIT